MPEFDSLRLDVEDDGARITLNRPDQRNAMDLAAQAELRAALDWCRGGIKVIVITGAGPAFCAGVDLKERRAIAAANTREAILSSQGNSWIATNMAIVDHPAVVVAAVNGFALGGGMTLINSCDLAIAADDAELGMPEVTFGTFPSYAGMSTRQRALPKAVAWMVLTGYRIDGRQAVEWGIVNRSVPREMLAGAIDALYDRLRGFDQRTLQICKQALREYPNRVRSYQDALEYGALFGHELRVDR